jgi:hypothetical protein
MERPVGLAHEQEKLGPTTVRTREAVATSALRTHKRVRRGVIVEVVAVGQDPRQHNGFDRSGPFERLEHRELDGAGAKPRSKPFAHGRHDVLFRNGTNNQRGARNHCFW